MCAHNLPVDWRMISEEERNILATIISVDDINSLNKMSVQWI